MHTPMLADNTSEQIYPAESAPATGRHARFEQLVNEHIPLLSRVAYMICSNRQTAEDIVQETLLLAWRHLDRLNNEMAIKGWLLTILRNERNRAFGKTPPPGVDVDIEQFASPDTSPDLDAEHLHRQVRALPERYRVPLQMYAFNGYRVGEISQSLGINRATVKTRLFRAREKLREAIESGDYFG